jgi:hypothetical protein
VIIIAIIVGLYVASLVGWALFVCYDTSDDPCYGDVDNDIDRRDGIRRAGGAKILEFKK